MIKQSMFKIVFIFIVAASLSGGVGHAAKLKRVQTSQLPKNFKPYISKTKISLTVKNQENAVIVLPEHGQFKGLGEKIQQCFAEQWGTTFPIVTSGNALRGSKNLILFGSCNSNSLLLRLNANQLLADNQKGYELRVIPDALNWKRDIMYFGGKNEKEILAGLKRFFEKFPKTSAIPFFIECKNWSDKRPDKREIAAMINEIRELYRKDGSIKNYKAIRDVLKKPAELFRRTGHAEYARAFAEMLKIFVENYDGALDLQKTPPHFVFYLLPQYIDLVEDSPAFTAQDSRRAAETIRGITEAICNLWAFSGLIKNYDRGITEYGTNSCYFSARSVGVAARYMLSHYNYEPAKYWLAVCDHAFDEIAKNPFSHEDASGYQYMSYNIFIDYALAGDRYSQDYFSNPLFKSFIKYCKDQFNPLGYTAGYGDAYPLLSAGPTRQLKLAVDVLGDQEAEYILSLIEKSTTPSGVRRMKKWTFRRDRPAPGIKSLGLNAYQVVPFKQKKYGVYGLYKHPTLDKGFFRGGWGKHGEFMAITGINGGPHGHFDANGISQYVRGNRLWLYEGDYIKKFPFNHNSLVVSRNGQAPIQYLRAPKGQRSTLSQILGAVQTPDRQSSLLSLMLQDYNGLDWVRNIAFEVKNGFWVIDKLYIKKSGHYITECRWRSPGNMHADGQTVAFVQKKSEDPEIPYHFFITSGNGASRLLETKFERGHGGKDGYIDSYKFADKYTRIVIQRRNQRFRRGEKMMYVNFFQTLPGESPKPYSISKLSNDAFLAHGKGFPRLAVLGKFNAPGIVVQAKALFIGPKGIVGRAVKMLRIDGKNIPVDKHGFVKLEPAKFPKGLTLGRLNELLGNLTASGKIVKPHSFAKIKTRDKKVSKIVDCPAEVSAIAAKDGFLGIGTQAGELRIVNTDGKQIFSRELAAAVSAVGAVNNKGKTYWVVGCEAPNPRKGDAPLYMFDNTGKQIWKNMIGYYHRRDGCARTIFPAQLDGKGSPEIIAGVDAWHYYAFDLNGKRLWRALLAHGATVGAAGDLDGDGKDEIAAGGFYYYQPLFDDDGKQILRKSLSPGAASVAVCDLNGDGMAEAVIGRADSYIYMIKHPKNKIKEWMLNVGGRPDAIVVLPEKQQARLAVATAMGTVSFISPDGKLLKVKYFPAPLSDLKLCKNRLLAVCMDGFIYSLDLDGKLTAKYSYQIDQNSIYLPACAVTKDVAAVFSGSQVYIIK